MKLIKAGEWRSRFTCKECKSEFLIGPDDLVTMPSPTDQSICIVSHCANCVTPHVHPQSTMPEELVSDVFNRRKR